MAPPGKASKQTSLDSFNRPGTRLTRKEVQTKGARATKSSGTQKDADCQEQNEGLAADCQEDDDSPAGQPILSTKEGRAFLEEEAIINPEEQIDVDVLAGALVQIALMDGMTSKASHAIRSVALMLAQWQSDAAGNSMLMKMETRMATMVDEMADKALAAARPQLQQMEALATALTGVQEKLTEVTDTLTGMSRDASKLTETVASYRDVVVRMGLSNSLRQPMPSLLSHPTPLAPRLQAREVVKTRQVLLDIDDNPGHEAGALLGDLITALKERLDEALCGSTDDGAQTSHKTRAVSKLRNGGILMELDSDSVAVWFAQDHVRQKFIQWLPLGINIKHRLFHTVVQFVPLTFRPEKEVDLHEVEEVNGLKTGDIVRAQWIKPIMRWALTQTCGHVVLAFSTPEATNEVLVHGLFICQKKVYTEKCKKELLRCLKCHGWGHLACNCPAPHDVCGTCAQHHKTSTCTNTARPHCVSCGIAGHASWDRSCPVFQRKCGEMNDRLEENSMPYYLTQEAWTQVREPPKMVYIAPPPPSQSAVGPRWSSGLTQSTLAWNVTGAAHRGFSAAMPPHQDRGQTWARNDGRDGLPPSSQSYV